jgi:hypothetical protein
MLSVEAVENYWQFIGQVKCPQRKVTALLHPG